MGWKSLERYKKEAYGSERFDLNLFDDFVKSNGITHYDGVYPERKSHPEIWKLHLDHAMFFRNKNTKNIILTSQPYYVTDIHELNVKEWALKHGFNYEIHEPSKSWYYPNKTYLIVISKEVKK